MITPKTRPFKEIQRAHDILTDIVRGRVPNPLQPDQRQLVHASLDVLCWVLGHHEGEGFGPNLKRIEAGLAAAGYVLHDHGYPGAANDTEARGEGNRGEPVQ